MGDSEFLNRPIRSLRAVWNGKGLKLDIEIILWGTKKNDYGVFFVHCT